jgi:transcriptional regulator with XRE-family HTH domain
MPGARRHDHLDIEHIGVQNSAMMLDSVELWQQASRELLRAIRGSRSQVAFSRRLGFRSNVAADWEGGHRSPPADVLLRAMGRVGIDCRVGFEAFHADTADAIDGGVAAWLSALRGSTPQSHVARRAGRSRHQVRRWLSGEATPRVPDFLQLIHALTGRGPDWVAAFVPIAQIPSLVAPWRAARTAARLAYDAPWSAAVRIVLDTDAYRRHGTDAWLAKALGLPPEALDAAVDALLGAGLATREGARLVPVSAFTADAAASEDDKRRLKAHWARVAAERVAAPGPDDMTSLNLVTLSEADLVRVQELQRAYFRELRSLVAASEPEEAAALVLMHVLRLA